MDLIGLLSRWLHIASAVALVGGALFARQVLLAPQEAELVARYAQVFLASIGISLLSGLYNLLAKAAVPPGYHAIFGVKFLLALHVYAIAWLVGRPEVEPGKRRRHLTGILISGGFVLALGAWLRFLSR